MSFSECLDNDWQHVQRDLSCMMEYTDDDDVMGGYMSDLDLVSSVHLENTVTDFDSKVPSDSQVTESIRFEDRCLDIGTSQTLATNVTMCIDHTGSLTRCRCPPTSHDRTFDTSVPMYRVICIRPVAPTGQ